MAEVRIRQKLHSGIPSEEEALILAKQFDALKQAPQFVL
jgi:hypothetical protein